LAESKRERAECWCAMKEREKKDRVCVIMIYSERLPSASIVTTATVPSNFRDRPATPHHPHWLPQASPSHPAEAYQLLHADPLGLVISLPG
jgi:hypothetical protein